MIPLIQWPSASQNPLITNQRIFTKNELVLVLYTTFLPNGQKLNPASLKHCRPIGIPTIVMHQSTPAKSQAKPPAKPPKINQIIFPRHPIKQTSTFYLNLQK